MKIDWTKPIRIIGNKTPARLICSDRKALHMTRIILAGCDVEVVHYVDVNGYSFGQPFIENITSKITKYAHLCHMVNDSAHVGVLLLDKEYSDKCQADKLHPWVLVPGSEVKVVEFEW